MLALTPDRPLHPDALTRAGERRRWTDERTNES